MIIKPSSLSVWLSKALIIAQEHNNQIDQSGKKGSIDTLAEEEDSDRDPLTHLVRVIHTKHTTVLVSTHTLTQPCPSNAPTLQVCLPDKIRKYETCYKTDKNTE